MNQKIKARRRFITRDQGLALSTEQLSSLQGSPVDGAPIDSTSYVNPASLLAVRTHSVSSDNTNCYATDEIHWTDSSETTCSGSNVSRLKDFWSQSERQSESETRLPRHSATTSVITSLAAESCFKPITPRHRGSTASESSSMAGIFSSTGGDSTPVSSRRRRVVTSSATTVAPPCGGKTTTDVSQVDAAVNRLSSLADSNQPTPTKSSISSSICDIRLNQSVGQDLPRSTMKSSALQAVDLRQPIVVMQPRTAVQLSMATTTPPVVHSSTAQTVGAPTGASKLVLSPTSAFSVAPQVVAVDGHSVTGRASHGMRERSRSANRQPKQGSSAVKRMAMLFEEPSSRRTDHSLDLPSKVMSAPRESSKLHNRPFSETGNEITPTVVNSELFFFSARVDKDRPSSKRKPDGGIGVSSSLVVDQNHTTHRRSPVDLSAANVRLSGQSLLVEADRRTSGSQVTTMATAVASTTFVATKSAILRQANGEIRPDTYVLTSSSTPDRQSRQLVVVSTDNKNTGLKHRQVENSLSRVANDIEGRSIKADSQLLFSGSTHRQQQQPQQQQQQAWTLDRKVVNKLATSQLPNQLSSTSIDFARKTLGRDRLNVLGGPIVPVVKSSAIDGNTYEKTDTIESAMTALETAISMLGSAVADRMDEVSIGSGKIDRSMTNSRVGNQTTTTTRQVVDQHAMASNSRLASGSKTDLMKPFKVQEDLSLQTTMNLLDKTIVEIDSAISVSDLSGRGNFSRNVNDRDATDLSAIVLGPRVHRWSPSTICLAGDIIGLCELELCGAESKFDRLPLADVGGSGNSSLTLASSSREVKQRVGTANSMVRERSSFLSEKQVDISDSRYKATSGSTLRTYGSNNISDVSAFRASTKVKRSELGSLELAASSELKTNDIWQTTDNRAVVRQMAAAVPTAMAAIEHRRIPPPLVREDSFNRPDSPLFHETLPLPADSAILRYRQQRPGASSSRSGRRSQQKHATRRMSSSSDSDTGQQRAPHTRRYQRQRSASAGARLQGRERRSRNRPGEASDDGMKSPGIDSMESDVDEITKQRLITAEQNSVLASRSPDVHPNNVQLELSGKKLDDIKTSFASIQSATTVDLSSTSTDIPVLITTSVPSSIVSTDTIVTAADNVRLQPNPVISDADKIRPDQCPDRGCSPVGQDVILADNIKEETKCNRKPLFETETTEASAIITETTIPEVVESSSRQSSTMVIQMSPVDSVQELGQESPRFEEQVFIIPVPTTAVQLLPTLLAELPEVGLEVACTDIVRLITASPEAEHRSPKCASVPTIGEPSHQRSSSRGDCNSDVIVVRDVLQNTSASLDVMMSLTPTQCDNATSTRSTTSAIPTNGITTTSENGPSSPESSLQSPSTAPVVLVTVEEVPVSEINLVVQQLKPVVCVEPDVVECVLVPVSPNSEPIVLVSASSSVASDDRIAASFVPSTGPISISTYQDVSQKLSSVASPRIQSSQAELVLNGHRSTNSTPMSSSNMRSPVISRRSNSSETMMTQQSPLSNDIASRSVAVQRMQSGNINRAADSRSKPTTVVSQARNRVSSDSAGGAGGSKARMKIVDISTCLSGEKSAQHDETKKPSTSSQLLNCATDVEQQARSIAELGSIAAQTRLLSASVNHVGPSVKVTGLTNLRTESGTRMTSGTSSSTAVDRRGVVATVAEPPQVIGRPGITTAGIIRKQLIYLDSVSNAQSSSSSVTSTSASGTSMSPKRIVRKSQTADLTSIGLGHINKATVTAKNSPMTTKVATTCGDFENLRRRGDSVVTSSASSLVSTKLDKPVPTASRFSSREQPRPPHAERIQAVQPQIRISTSRTQLSQPVTAKNVSKSERNLPGFGVKSSPPQTTRSKNLHQQPTFNHGHSAAAASTTVRRAADLISDDDLDRLVEINVRHSRMSTKPISK